MTLAEYQRRAGKFAVYPDLGKNFIYPTLGLAGEAGEAANKVKKILRDRGGVLNKKTAKLVADELGDTLWYLSQCAREIGFSLNIIAESNLHKLRSRKKRGKISGRGDNR